MVKVTGCTLCSVLSLLSLWPVSLHFCYQLPCLSESLQNCDTSHQCLSWVRNWVFLVAHGYGNICANTTLFTGSLVRMLTDDIFNVLIAFWFTLMSFVLLQCIPLRVRVKLARGTSISKNMCRWHSAIISQVVNTWAYGVGCLCVLICANKCTRTVGMMQTDSSAWKQTLCVHRSKNGASWYIDSVTGFLQGVDDQVGSSQRNTEWTTSRDGGRNRYHYTKFKGPCSCGKKLFGSGFKSFV